MEASRARGRWSKLARITGWVVAVMAVLVLLVALNLGAIVTCSLTPGAAVADETPPPAPDYADPGSWSALTER